MDQTQAIQKQFGAVAAGYAVSMVHVGGPDLDEMVAAAGPRAAGRVLDVGCGAGHTALAFAAGAAEVVALDLTEAMLDQARRLAGERGLANVAFRRGDAAELPFADGSFDVVTSRLCAHHYARPAESACEAARVLAPGGVYLLVDSVAPEDAALDTFMNTYELLRDPSHVRDHRVSEWTAMFRAAGFDPETLGHWPLPIDFDDWVGRMRTADVAVAALRALFDDATEEARKEFAIRDDYAFVIPAALLRGVKPEGR